jgi:hypothetical protein
MSEKHYTVKDLKSHNDYRFTISYNSFTVEFILQSSYAKDRYESGPINLSGFRQKNKVFNQFDSTLKIADVIGSKIEKKQYSLEVPVFILNYDFQENIRFDLKPSKGASTSVAANPDVTKQRIANLDKIAKEQIKAAQRNSYTGSKNQIQFSQPQPPKPRQSFQPPQPPKQVQSYKPQPQPPKPVQSYKPPTQPQPPKPATSYQQPKTVNPPYQAPSKPPTSNVVSNTSTTPTLPIVGSYVPPSMDKNGTLFQRIEKCKKLKTDMKKNLEDIYNRLNDVKRRIDNFVDKAFANNPTADDKKKALNLITEVFLLRQGFKDIDNYPEIFQNEVKQKNISFNAVDKEKFDDDMLLLGKAFPYALTPFHQKIDHLFIQVQHNFFKEKNLRFYKERELADILKTKDKLFNKL